MRLHDQLVSDVKGAMKAGEKERLSVLRMLQSALMNEAIAQKKKEEGLTDDEAVAVLSREAKRRQEAAQEYEKAGRTEQAEAERSEYDIITAYLPEQLSEDDIRSEVQAVIDDMGASSPQDMGRVMGAVMQRVKGRADGSMVRSLVESELQSQ